MEDTKTDKNGSPLRSFSVKTTNGEIPVPILNLGNTTLTSHRKKFKWLVDPVESTQIYPLSTEENLHDEVDEPVPESHGTLDQPDTQETTSLWADIPVGSVLTDQERTELQALLRKHAQCFSTELGHTKLLQNHIESNDNQPI